MSFHTDYESWVRMSDPQHCPVCQNLPMPDGMCDIAELPHSWLSVERVDCLKGACSVIAKKHAIELYDLDDDELSGLMKEVGLYARVLKQVLGAVKINYEIHGNSVPHLHVHLYPRSMDDPFPGQAIDYKRKRSYFTEKEFAAFLESMRAGIFS